MNKKDFSVGFDPDWDAVVLQCDRCGTVLARDHCELNVRTIFVAIKGHECRPSGVKP